MDAQDIGLIGEQQALTYLEKKGLKLLARNYRCLMGEIDLVMREKEELVFIEVRKRANSQFATPIESVTSAKQRKIIKTALHYMQKLHSFEDIQFRFDIVGISENQIEWIKDAFNSDHI